MWEAYAVYNREELSKLRGQTAKELEEIRSAGAGAMDREVRTLLKRVSLRWNVPFSRSLVFCHELVRTIVTHAARVEGSG